MPFTYEIEVINRRIRDFTPGEVEDVNRLLRKLIDGYFTPLTADRAASLASRNIMGLVHATPHDDEPRIRPRRIVGYALLVLTERTVADYATLHEVVSDDGHRRRGNMRRLLTAMFRSAESSGVKLVHSVCGTHRDAAPHELYRSLGMKGTPCVSYGVRF